MMDDCPELTEGSGRVFTWPDGGALAAASAAGWPSVPLYTLTIAGETAWRDALRRVSLQERALLLDALGCSWMSDAMAATPAACVRLRRWYEAGRPVPTPDEIRRRLAFVGDPEIRAIVLRALVERVPSCVVDHVLGCCWVLGVGWSANGWMSPAPPIPAALSEPLRLLLVDGQTRDAEETASTFAHEVGHSLTLAPTDPETAVEPVVEREVRQTVLTQLAVACGQLETWIDRDARAERWAAACARAWGFKGAAADGTRCASNRLSTRRRGAAALPPFGTTPGAP